MSITYEDECCACATESYPCMGLECKDRKVPHFFCDKCHYEFDSTELYDDDGDHLCQECLLNKFPTVAEQIDKGIEVLE